MLPIVATEGTEELHCTRLVMFCVLPSLKVPKAVNCWLNPTATFEVDGETKIDTNTGGGLLTVKLVEPFTELNWAFTVVTPAATAVASPPVVIVATF